MAFVWEKLLRPVMFGLDAERADEIGIRGLRAGLSTATARKLANSKYGFRFEKPLERFGLNFDNPLGMAAGFDKNGIVIDQLAALGFGFVEAGTVTFRPQPGNPKPRMFRLPDDHALINRLGFNNEGAAKLASRLAKIDRNCVVGVNIGKNKDVPIEEATENYLASFELVHPTADYVAVNISSPNTPNLRELQRSENLEELISGLQDRNRELGEKPLLVKIAPDLSGSEIEAAVDICRRYKVSGIVATNTTVKHDGLRTKETFGDGGVSGRPLAASSNTVISTIFRYAHGKLPIIGVGGVFTPRDAFEKIASGASLIQAYTGFVYSGPSFAFAVNEGLSKLLKEKGFADLDEAVGSAVKS